MSAGHGTPGEKSNMVSRFRLERAATVLVIAHP
jgi:hypothetical protein